MVSDYTSFVWSLKNNVYVIVQVISSINIMHGLLHLNRNIVQIANTAHAIMILHTLSGCILICMQTIEAFFPPPETPLDTTSCSCVCPVEFFLAIPTRSEVWCHQETFTRIPTVSENDTILYTLMGLFQVA